MRTAKCEFNRLIGLARHLFDGGLFAFQGT
jgi:hypothetical protein